MRGRTNLSDEHLGIVAGLLRDLGIHGAALSQLVAHAHAVRASTERLDLVSVEDRDVVLIRHTADSLLTARARRPQPGERWVDVGSGAGFPGVPLACCFPETEFVLCEPQPRRAGFLDMQVLTLGLTNAEVWPRKASTLSPGFDVAIARALADPAIALEALLRLVEPDGTALLAVGAAAVAPQGADDVDVSRPNIDSPGRLFMISHDQGSA